ncbi:hypothetical protein CHLRE_02g095033v5 [Chlamydomonas reinhardtii]|uniref:Uncharacterized protein n=1 Tax=Chlamydomonas reinhardtii TaxID=3055 RepID=A0A2K3E1I9_CHLRE|nr:uncharacterized protein CHLRE_02g095033v5 [Chlamydomonas reinhardtii]PNW86643.1 hypothetical protein CHLRE_02g095033v5 [Chlamydomonas reinhardtii]
MRKSPLAVPLQRGQAVLTVHVPVDTRPIIPGTYTVTVKMVGGPVWGAFRGRTDLVLQAGGYPTTSDPSNLACAYVVSEQCAKSVGPKGEPQAPAGQGITNHIFACVRGPVWDPQLSHLHCAKFEMPGEEPMQVEVRGAPQAAGAATTAAAGSPAPAAAGVADLGGNTLGVARPAAAMATAADIVDHVGDVQMQEAQQHSGAPASQPPFDQRAAARQDQKQTAVMQRYLAYMADLHLQQQRRLQQQQQQEPQRQLDDAAQQVQTAYMDYVLLDARTLRSAKRGLADPGGARGPSRRQRQHRSRSTSSLMSLGSAPLHPGGASSVQVGQVLAAKLAYHFSFLNPSPAQLKELTDLVDHFAARSMHAEDASLVSHGNPLLLPKRETACLPYKDGGVNHVDLPAFLSALQAKTFARPATLEDAHPGAAYPCAPGLRHHVGVGVQRRAGASGAACPAGGRGRPRAERGRGTASAAASHSAASGAAAVAG